MTFLIRISIALCVALCVLTIASSLLAQQLPLRRSGGTYIGDSTNIGWIAAMTRDENGNVYGLACATGMPTTVGAYSTRISGQEDICVFKMNPTLSTLIWSTYIGGSGSFMEDQDWECQEAGYSIKVTKLGEVIIAGTTHSPNFPLTTGVNSCSTNCTDSAAIFILKLNSSGSSLVYSRILGYTTSIDGDVALAKMNIGLAVDDVGNTFVGTYINNAGATVVQPQYTTTYNAYQGLRKQGMSPDLVVTKLSASGTILYSSYIGGLGSYMSTGLCYGDGKVYITGSATASDFPIVGTIAGPFIMKLDDHPQDLVISAVLPLQANQLPIDLDYDKVAHCPNFISAAPAVLFTVDSSLNSLATQTQLSGAFKLHVGRDGRKYIWYKTGMEVIEKDGIGSLCDLHVNLGPDYTQDDIDTWGSAPYEYGENCRMNVVVGVSLIKDSLRAGPSAYQKLKLNSSVQPAMVMFSIDERDSIFIDTTQACGSYVFSELSQPCRGQRYIWNFSDGSPSVNSDQPVGHTFGRNGMFVVNCRVLLDNGDTNYVDTTIFVHSYLTLHMSPQTIYRCVKDSGIHLSAFGAMRYEWHPGATLSDSTSPNPIAKPTKNMMYYVRGYDANGCFVDDSIQAYVIATKAHVSTIDTTICQGSSVSLTASGAAEFKWFPPDGLSSTKTATVAARPQKTTSYTVVVYEANCPDTTHVIVRLSHKPALHLNPEAIVCSGGSTSLSARVSSIDSLDTLGVIYQWSPTASLQGSNTDTPTATPKATTRYYCVATNKFGCSTVDSVDVRVQQSLNLQLTADTSVCVGNSITLRASGGATYSWSPHDGLDDSTKATPVCSPTKNTTYTVMTWSGDFRTASCRDTSVVKVNVYTFPTVHASGSTTVCKNTAVTLHSTVDTITSSMPAYERVWRIMNGAEVGRSESIEVSTDSSTSYIVTISNAQGCSSSDTVHVTIANALSVKANAIAAVLPGSVVKLSVVNPQAGTQYTWLDATRTVIAHTDTTSTVVNTPSWFYVHAINGGCEGWDSVFVDITDVIHVQACQDFSLCKGEMVRLYVVNPQLNTNYQWTADRSSWSATGDTVFYRADESRMFYVSATQGTKHSLDTVLVSVFDLPTISARDTTVCSGNSVVLRINDTNTTNSYVWHDAANKVVSRQNTYVTSQAGRYSIVATSIHGCVDSGSIGLSINPRTSLSFSIGNIDSIFPGAITQVPIYAKANAELSNVRVQAKLRVPKLMLKSDQATIVGNELVFSIDTALSLHSIPVQIARFSIEALVNQEHRVDLQLSELQSNIDTSCTDLRGDPQTLVVRTVCGNTWFNVEYKTVELSIVPNPSNGDVEIHSSTAVQVFDALGHEVELNAAQQVLPGETHVWSLHELHSGVYFVQMLVGGEVMVRKMVVWR